MIFSDNFYKNFPIIEYTKLQKFDLLALLSLSYLIQSFIELFYIIPIIATLPSHFLYK